MKLPALILSLIVAFYASSSFAAKWYKVEMILVAYTNISDINKEYWPIELENKPIYSPKTRISWLSVYQSQSTNKRVIRRFGAPNSKTKTTGKLFSELRTPSLYGYAKKIDNEPFINVVYHQSWLEPIQTKKKASYHNLNVTLHDSEDTSDTIKINGQFKLYRSRYLHISTNFHVQHYSKQTKPKNNTDTPNQVAAEQLVPMRAAQVKLSRRMRSNELHYLDHPMLGIIIKTTPVN